MPPPMRTSSRSPRRYPSASREGPGKVSERAPPSNSNPPVVTDDLQATFDPVTCAGGLTPRRPPSVPTRRHRDDPRDRTQTPRPSPKDPKRRGDHPEAKAGQARAPVPSPGPALGGAEGEAKAGPTAQEPVVGYSPPGQRRQEAARTPAQDAQDAHDAGHDVHREEAGPAPQESAGAGPGRRRSVVGAPGRSVGCADFVGGGGAPIRLAARRRDTSRRFWRGRRAFGAGRRRPDSPSRADRDAR